MREHSNFEAEGGFTMSENYVVTAEAIEDDVLIPLPNEFEFEPGDEFEIKRRPDGVIIMTCPERNVPC